MSTKTSIEWTDRTWNPVTGCSKVSPGCAHCYAEGVADRFWATQYPPIAVEVPIGDCTVDGDANVVHRPRVFTDVLTHEDRLLEPLSWRKPSKVFVNSMSDLFHEDVPWSFIERVFDVMQAAKRHTFQVLTKRAENMRLFAEYWAFHHDGPLPNVWLGVSCENQHFYRLRLKELLQTPAAVRFLSCEPLLGELFLALNEGFCRACKQWTAGSVDGHCFDMKSPCFAGEMAIGDGIYWVIVGGESGAGARPFDIQWARDIVNQCQAAGVPVFVKQLGARCVTDDGGYPVSAGGEWPDGVRAHVGATMEAPRRIQFSDKKGGDPLQWPADLRVRQFPDRG